MARHVTAFGIVETFFTPAPIPTRDYDWAATHENYEPGMREYGRVGLGATEEAAVADLLEQMEAA